MFGLHVCGRGMARQLLFLTAVVASLGQTDVSKCSDLFSDGKCQNDTTALLQVASDTETQKMAASSDDSLGPGPNGPLHLVEGKETIINSMNEWNSSRDLARVWGLQKVMISPTWTVQIFSAVPVFGKDESYIALLVEGNEPGNEGDAWDSSLSKWMQDFDTFVMFCAGPDGSHKTQVIARGHSWVCPWPREEWQTKRFNVFLQDNNGTNFGMVVAEHNPKLLGQYKTMACVRDLYNSPDPLAREPFSGVLKQWVEWIEWSSLHGLEHFLIYTFEGTDLAAKNIMAPYLDAGIASRVHFQFFPAQTLSRQGEMIQDCLYRAKNHAKWLAVTVDVDEYMVFPGKVKYFDFDGILTEQGLSEDTVASLNLKRIRFARARPETFEISSDHREPSFQLDDNFKPVLLVDNVYRSGFHQLAHVKTNTKGIFVHPELAVINHYRAPTGNLFENQAQVDYENLTFNDPFANKLDQQLQKEIPMLEAAIAKRFNIQAADVKSFLKKLAFTRPPDSITAAASHKTR